MNLKAKKKYHVTGIQTDNVMGYYEEVRKCQIIKCLKISFILCVELEVWTYSMYYKEISKVYPWK